MRARVKDTHEEIIGTLDRTPGCALIQSFDLNADGTIDPEFEGETKMFWDGQITEEHDDGSPVYLDQYGSEYHARQLELYEPCHLCEGSGQTSQYDKTARANTMQPCPACAGDGAARDDDGGNIQTKPFPIPEPTTPTVQR